MTKWYYTHTISWVPHRIPFLHDYVRNYDKNSGWYWWDSYVKAWQTTHSQVLAALRNIHLQRCHWGPCKVSLLIELTQYHTVSHTVKDQSEEHLSNTCALSYMYKQVQLTYSFMHYIITMAMQQYWPEGKKVILITFIITQSGLVTWTMSTRTIRHKNQNTIAVTQYTIANDASDNNLSKTSCQIERTHSH